MSTPDPTPTPHKKMGMFHDPIPPSVFEPVPSDAAPHNAVVTERHRNLARDINARYRPVEAAMGPWEVAQIVANSEAAAVAEATAKFLIIAEEWDAIKKQLDADLTDARTALARSEAREKLTK